MLELPRNVSPLLRERLEELLSQPQQRSIAEICAALVTAVFKPEFAVACIEIEGSGRFRQLQYADSLEERSFEKLWLDSGAHEAAVADLRRRSHPVSYSALSWPYPKVPGQNGRAHQEIPPQYSILFPVTSALTIRLPRERDFYGYILAAFPGFPNLSEDLVQEIVSISPFLSELSAALLRHYEGKSEKLGMLAHNVKHYGMILEELVNSARNESAGQSERFYKKMEKTLRTMLLEANSILLMDKEDSGHLKITPMEVSLNEIVQESVNEFSPLFEARQIALELILSKERIAVSLDPAIFPTILHNLLDNALKYSPSNSTVTVRTSVGYGSFASVTVEDSGIGIPENELSMIFSRNFRASNAANYTGYGLGLYLVKTVVEAHGGSIDVRSSEGEGTTFSISFPVLREERVS